MKCVIVLAEDLAPGLAVNTAAALGLSLGNHVPGLIGPDARDADGRTHRGITAVPIPILSAEDTILGSLFDRAGGLEGMTVLGFSNVAQSCHQYEAYVARLENTPAAAVRFRGICLYGPRKTVNSLCGALKLLR